MIPEIRTTSGQKPGNLREEGYRLSVCAGVHFNVVEAAFTISKLVEQISELRKQQIDASDRATYLGWTAETQAEFDRRADLISALIDQLAKANGG